MQSPAHLVANGAAVDVPVLYTCSGTSGPAGLDVHVTERVSGNAIADGFGFLQGGGSCTGEIKSATIEVTANPGRAFARGSAVATGDIFACRPNSTFCGDGLNTQTITIVK